MTTVVRRGIHAVMALALLVTLAAPALAQINVYFRFGSGMVVLVPRYTAVTWYRARRGYIVNTLPYGYVSQPYSYYYGHPTYYPTTVWVRHHRRWRGEPERYYRHDNGRHRGWYKHREKRREHGHHD